MNAIHGMKIYAMTERDWYVAPTMEQALAEYMGEMCCKTETELQAEGLLPNDYPRELSEEDLDRLKIAVVKIYPEGEDTAVRTFREHLTQEPPTTAEMFCSLDY